MKNQWYTKQWNQEGSLMYWHRLERLLLRVICGKISLQIIIMTWIMKVNVWETIIMKRLNMILKENRLLLKRLLWAIRHLFKQLVYRQISINRIIYCMILKTHFKKCSLKKRLTDRSIMIQWLISGHRNRDQGWIVLWKIFRTKSKEWKVVLKEEGEEGDWYSLIIIQSLFKFVNTVYLCIIFRLSAGIESMKLSCSILTSSFALSMQPSHNLSRYVCIDILSYSFTFWSWSDISSIFSY